jgi:sporulation protein YlmC with PRC-barrel domain
VIAARDLIGCEVETQSGEALGHCWDLRIASDGGGAPRLEGLLIGRLGFLQRMGLTRVRQARRRGEARHRDVDVIPWEDVIAVEHGSVKVRRPAT